jgi:hypothetical protein
VDKETDLLVEEQRTLVACVEVVHDSVGKAELGKQEEEEEEEYMSYPR